jgi:hypothetical protein
LKDLYEGADMHDVQRQFKMGEKIKKKLQEESAKFKASEAKLGKEISDAGDKIVAKVRKATGKPSAKVDDDATPPD